jgi:thiamine phosphate synthase YjbQ (UPF0047 family)
MRKIAAAWMSAQIEPNEIDAELKDDITRLLSNDSPPSKADKQNHYLSYAC